LAFLQGPLLMLGRATFPLIFEYFVVPVRIVATRRFPFYYFLLHWLDPLLTYPLIYQLPPLGTCRSQSDYLHPQVPSRRKDGPSLKSVQPFLFSTSFFRGRNHSKPGNVPRPSPTSWPILSSAFLKPAFIGPASSVQTQL